LTQLPHWSAQYELADMRLFVSVAETNSLTLGAKRSYMSLSAASTRIKHIEERLGTRLLDRNRRGVTLTPAGQTFLHHGRVVLRQLENLQADLQEYSQGVKGHLRVLANTTAITEFLPATLPKYLLAHPNVNIDLRERMSHEIVRAVSEGTADIGIISSEVRTEQLRVLPYRQDRLLLTTALDHPLASYEKVAFKKTLQFDYVCLLESSSIQVFLSQNAIELGKRLRIRIQVSNFEAQCRMVAAGVGIGVLPNSGARRYAKIMPIRIIPLADKWAVRNLSICLRDLRSLPSFAKDLVELLTAERSSDPSWM
jgi:DNA-binding transcriptional LysR family regulator